MDNPGITYRIQFNKDFTFKNFKTVIPYLHRLGIKTIYASPVFEATPGSMHGYDVINPHRINPEIGTLEELRDISKALTDLGMGWIQDIVPNHMAFHSGNEWLMDIFEKGRASLFASFFDLGWTSELFSGRVIVPFLGEPLKNLIEKKEIQIAYSKQRFVVQYHQQEYPIKSRSYAMLFDRADAPESVKGLVDQINQIFNIDSSVEYSLRWHEVLLQISSLIQVEEIKEFVDDVLSEVNDDAEKLRAILDEQTYALTSWRVTDKRINFRRFFTVNELIGLNMQDEKVFDHYHRFIKQLLDEGVFHGLRLDHIDGLYNPTEYLVRLRKLVGDDTFIVAEKIVQRDEQLPDWPIQGLTGYEFLTDVNGLLSNARSERKLTKFYSSVTGDKKKPQRLVLEKKRLILKNYMQGELNNLTHLFFAISDKIESGEATRKEIKKAIGEMLVHFPVYRFYGSTFPLPPSEAEQLSRVLDQVEEKLQGDAVRVLRETLLDEHGADDEKSSRQAIFYQRLMQFTGPLMAKGIEDTLFYSYNRFISHNEVGGSPEEFAFSVETFHKAMMTRRAKTPTALNATATHDTKRGEDFRARLNAFSSLPDELMYWIRTWEEQHNELVQNDIPDANDRYFIWQTLIGAYTPEESFGKRLEEYLIKAFREAKRQTNWNEPAEQYEAGVLSFVRALLSKESFIASLRKAVDKISPAAYLNSLVQTVLKFTCPGTPDIYQGTEHWDFSFVDPDNRRQVDYELRDRQLNSFPTKASGDLLKSLWETKDDGAVKLYLTHRLCTWRSQYADLFSGDYIPVKVRGVFRDHVIAFARRHQDRSILIVLPLNVSGIAEKQGSDVLNIDWKDTTIELSAGYPSQWKSLFTEAQSSHTGEIAVSDLFAHFPLALVEFTHRADKRSAGILMHVTSLPSGFHVGDLGPSAYAFADFLHAAGQRWWQVLPLNPTASGTGYSPYSSPSSMAGNPLLISPDVLVDDGLLSASDLPVKQYSDKSDFTSAQALKEQLFTWAWNNFKKQGDDNAFRAFVMKENYWLRDYALYVCLTSHFSHAPWSEWPAPYRDRDEKTLEEFSKEHEDEMKYAQFLQFVFDKQWNSLRAYCASREIKLIGDIPFYVVFDSADAWSHPEIFLLDENRKPTAVAGVPPDYFNKDGQLWGMPVFNWKALRETNYAWWKQRLKKNIEMFDVVRLDHFRAFAAFWQVDASEKTAVRGSWTTGGGRHFFEALRNEFGELPFIAEDLGEITQDVYDLRDEFKFPGMKVLQFAFTDNVSTSPHAPHNLEKNFVVYTGTHDNNTTLGWYAQELDQQAKRNIGSYSGQTITPNKVTDIMIRMAYSSVCDIAILPMQDVLSLNESARMNIPGSGENNWTWQLDRIPGKDRVGYLRTLTTLFRR